MAGKRRKRKIIWRKPSAKSGLLLAILTWTLFGIWDGHPQILLWREHMADVLSEVGANGTGQGGTTFDVGFLSEQGVESLINGYVKAEITVLPYGKEAYTTLNGNEPFFSEEERRCIAAFEYYSELDSFGRCGMTVANVCVELMPTAERGEIGQVKPSGWHTVKYDSIADRYLYNRCHLIGYQLTGENANVNNLITGTRYLNIEGMLSFENQIANYVKDTGNHVLYRVVPYFSGDNLVADGVLMEGWSVEDGGAGICFCVFAYNVQPGIVIDYATGDSYEAGSMSY